MNIGPVKRLVRLVASKGTPVFLYTFHVHTQQPVPFALLREGGASRAAGAGAQFSRPLLSNEPSWTCATPSAAMSSFESQRA